ncbi:putative RxLR effector, partial [Phytophthora palmivora]
MRLRYFLLAAGIGLLATSEAFLIEPDTSSKISSNIIDSNRNYEYNNRFLRTGKVTNAGTVKNDEERAISSIQGFLLDKTATKAWLNFFLERGLSVQQVKEQYLAMPSHLSFNQMLEHINWNALVKYQRMKWEHSNGKKVPYAYFGSGYQTEEKTKE